MSVFEVTAEILMVKLIGPNIYQTLFSAPEIAREARAGQFINIKCSPGYDPLLRRPLTIFRTNATNGTIEVVFKVVGRGTELLAQRQPGERVEILGPLGNGFTLRHDKLPILVSGGIGVASLMFLAEELVRNRQTAKGNLPNISGWPFLYALLGAHTRSELVCVEDFAALEKAQVRTWVNRSNLESCLAELLIELEKQGIQSSDCCIYACGPNPMLRRLAEFSSQQSILCQVSLESHMACGLGTCQNCICKLNNADTYKLVCKHGPVFSAEEVVWND